VDRAHVRIQDLPALPTNVGVVTVTCLATVVISLAVNETVHFHALWPCAAAILVRNARVLCQPHTGVDG
jgi:hypothetical protein